MNNCCKIPFLFTLKSLENLWFSDDFRGNRSQLVRLISLNIKNEILRESFNSVVRDLLSRVFFRTAAPTGSNITGKKTHHKCLPVNSIQLFYRWPLSLTSRNIVIWLDYITFYIHTLICHFILTHVWPVLSIYTPWKHQEVFDILEFSGAIKQKHWSEIG